MASARTQQFREFVGQNSFVCSVGSALAKTGRMPVFEMEPTVPLVETARDAVRALLKLGRGNAVAMLYPEEPDTFARLVELHREVHADIFAVCMAESALAEHRAGRMRLPRAGLGLPRPLFHIMAGGVRSAHKAPFMAVEGARLVEEMGVGVAADPYSCMDETRAAAAALLGVDPNLMVGVAGNPLQAIVMSPVYTGDSSQRVTTALHALGLRDGPHGRFAPATGMVINYAQDVLDARFTQAGKDIRARMASGAGTGRYNAMHVLAGKPDEEMRYQKLLTVLRERAAIDQSH